MGVHPQLLTHPLYTALRQAVSESQMGCPNPAARRVASSGPRPTQQLASLPSIITAGMERTSRRLARLATSVWFGRDVPGRAVTA
jgi:hypothetical protein